MQRDLTYLLDIYNSAKIAIEYLNNYSYEEFLKDIKTQDAVIKRLEVIGEASNRVDLNFQIKHSGLPWNQMKGMRNILIHEYDAIDLVEVWETVQRDLPELLRSTENILKNEGIL